MTTAAAGIQRAQIALRGAVQGVGFRPFVYRLARELRLTGWVRNSPQGVSIEVEAARPELEAFLRRLERSKPPHAVIEELAFSFLDPLGYDGFEIRRSASGDGEKSALVLPDLATCADCLREIFDPANRRHRYPFTNCTNCGPRFSIIEALPYDRPNTSMKKFAMCIECAREYRDPLNRRFDAQPIACPACGPQLELWDGNGVLLGECDDALLQAARAVREGRIVAVKGLGGFQLIADAREETVVARLRGRKQRQEKPFALMFPSLEMTREHCAVSELEGRLLLSAQAPIVLVRRVSGITNSQSAVAPCVAPGNPNLGVMLPCTPLHHLLMRELDFPIIATSGNLSEEPICTDEHDALKRLRGIADFYLVHDRPIARHVDDSVVRVICGREMVLRRARGYAPLPIRLSAPPAGTLAMGAHLKNAIALSVGANVFISQHIGDLTTAEAHSAFHKSAVDLPRLYDAKIARVACDLHPDYLSTKYAEGLSAPLHRVQHHLAHVLSCMAENQLAPPVLGVAWDGTGDGGDGTVWGGEFLLVKQASFERVAHLRQFRLPGGEAAIREPRRAAFGVLHAMFGDDLWTQRELLPSFTKSEIGVLRQMIEKRVNAPLTSSAGRLFDAVAALAGLRQRSSFEGQAAMELEFAITPGIDSSYPVALGDTAPRVIDWHPAISQMLIELRDEVPPGVVAAKFHNTLVEMIVAVARVTGEREIALSGGCFQNKYLIERAVRRLREEDFRPRRHLLVPPNDGGIALGQIVAAAAYGTRMS
jgi:hydrogenase maturation protein HypF